LRILADRAYPDLPEEARERFALNQYLAQLDNPQVAFSVKQTKPKTVDDAVRSTLEMESFLKPRLSNPKEALSAAGKQGASSAVSQALEGEHQAHVSTIIPTLSVTSGKDCMLEGLVNGVPTSILIDTGAATSVLNRLVGQGKTGWV